MATKIAAGLVALEQARTASQVSAGSMHLRHQYSPQELDCAADAESEADSKALQRTLVAAEARLV